MKARVSPTARKLWLVSLLGVVLLAGVALASDRRLIPPDGLPVWERGLGVSDSGIVVFVFYRPMELVPPGHDFHNVLDFSALTIPPLVQGFDLWDEGAAAPKQVVLENAEGKQVVICFVDSEELAPLWFDGTPFTIDELQAMESLQIGYASFYHEVLHPDKMIEVVAKGLLEDGQPFFVATPAKTTIVRIGE